MTYCLNKNRVQATGITVERGGRKLLDGIEIEFVEGEVLAVLGPNGAGKSTLLKVLTGELSPDYGEVRMGGVAIHGMKTRELARKRAVLPQHSELSFPFLAYEVVLMGREPHLNGVESEYDHLVVWKAMKAVDILHLAQRNYHLLSGGERQRVHLARVLAQVWPKEGRSPAFLFLDEPTSNLDLSHQYSLLQVARELALKGLGIFIILHDLNLAVQFSDRVLLLDQGRIVAEASDNRPFKVDDLQKVFSLPMETIVHPTNGRGMFIPRPIPQATTIND